MICHQQIEFGKMTTEMTITLVWETTRGLEYPSKAVVQNEVNTDTTKAEDLAATIDHHLWIIHKDLTKLMGMEMAEMTGEGAIIQATPTWREMAPSREFKVMALNDSTIMARVLASQETGAVSHKLFRINTHTIMALLKIFTGLNRFNLLRDQIIKLKFSPINRKLVISIPKICRTLKLI